jgi:hypothetical protein
MVLFAPGPAGWPLFASRTLHAPRQGNYRTDHFGMEPRPGRLARIPACDRSAAGISPQTASRMGSRDVRNCHVFGRPDRARASANGEANRISAGHRLDTGEPAQAVGQNSSLRSKARLSGRRRCSGTCSILSSRPGAPARRARRAGTVAGDGRCRGVRPLPVLPKPVSFRRIRLSGDGENQTIPQARGQEDRKETSEERECRRAKFSRSKDNCIESSWETRRSMHGTKPPAMPGTLQRRRYAGLSENPEAGRLELIIVVPAKAGTRLFSSPHQGHVLRARSRG